MGGDGGPGDHGEPEPDEEDPRDDDPRHRPHLRELFLGALLAALLSSVLVAGLIRIWDQPLRVPFQYALVNDSDEQDASLEAMVDANVAQTGWYFHNPRLNAPYGQDWIEWPMGGDTAAYVIKRGLAVFTADPYLIMNVFWLLTFPIVAATAYPALRLLRASLRTALVGAVLYSLAPYHFRNGVGHENLAFYAAIPFAVVLCVQLLGARPPGFRLRVGPPPPGMEHVLADGGRVHWFEHMRLSGRIGRLLWPLAAVVLISLDNFYYLAFFLFAGGVCAVVGALARRDWRPLVSMAALGTVGLVVSLAANLPTLLWTRGAGPNPVSPLARTPGSSEAYPLRPIELFTPVAGHRFPPFDWLSSQLAPRGGSQFTTANLGLFAGFGVTIGVVLLASRIIRRDRHDRATDLRLGAVIVVAVGLAVAGGGSRLLEITGAGSIRAWSRIGIFIAFAGVALMCRQLDRFHTWLLHARPASAHTAWPLVLVAVVAFSVLDQVTPAAIPDARRYEAAHTADEMFVTALEDRLPDDAMVFQLPSVPFPEAGAAAFAADYDLLKQGYLHSDTLRWSAGGMRGRSGDWQVVATMQPMPILVRGLAAVGFKAITVDRHAYYDHGEARVKALTDLLGEPFATSQDRLLAWDLQDYADDLRAASNPAQLDLWRDQMLDAPRLYMTSDDLVVTSGTGEGSFCRQASVDVVVPAGRVWTGTLTFKLQRVQIGDTTPTAVRIGDTDHSIPPTDAVTDLPATLSGTTKVTVGIPTRPVCTAPASTRVTLAVEWHYDDPS